MVHGLGFEVVAEGVETEDQLSKLHDMQCEHAQGHLFSQPITAEAFTYFLRDKLLTKSTSPPPS